MRWHGPLQKAENGLQTFGKHSWRTFDATDAQTGGWRNLFDQDSESKNELCCSSKNEDRRFDIALHDVTLREVEKRLDPVGSLKRMLKRILGRLHVRLMQAANAEHCPENPISGEEF